ncbi:MAG: AAA family ATPase [Vulcanibacillus sp.]
MRGTNLVIADKDIEYIELFKRYVRETEYEKKFTIKSFSTKENVEQYLLNQSNIEIILIDIQLLSDNLALNNVKTIILLSEKDRIDKEWQYPVVYKYQPLNRLISQVLGLFLETKEENKKINNDYKTKVLSIYSATGGSGKTTLAVNTAKRLSLKGNKVFYLTLGLITSVEVFFPSSGTYDFSKILYYLKNNNNQVVSKIEMLKKYDVETKVDYLESFVNAEEIFDLTIEDVKLLIESIKLLEIYNYIIIDLEVSLHEYVIGALKESEYIIWLILDDIQSIEKTKVTMNILENFLNENYETLAEKIVFIHNKKLGTDMQNNFSGTGIDLFGYLPYIPEWKIITSKNQLLTNNLFNSKIDDLLISVIND